MTYFSDSAGNNALIQSRVFIDSSLQANHFKKCGNVDHKYSLNRTIIEEILSCRCACTLEGENITCLEDFSVKAVKEIRKEWTMEGEKIINEFTMYQKLIHYLNSNKLDRQDSKDFHQVI